MSSFKIACPHCDQHIACDASYSGMKIPCPGCGREMTIPALGTAAPSPSPAAAAPAAPTAPAGAPIRLTVRPAQHSPPPAAPAPAPIPSVSSPGPLPRPQPAARAGDTDAAPSKGRLVLKIALGILIGGPLLYLLFQWAGNSQRKFNEARAKDDDPGVLGGQVSHIMELNQMLDATDPGKMGRVPDDASGAAGVAGRARRLRSAPAGGTAPSAAEPPAVPPSWTLDLAMAQIPAGRVCGTISKQNFTADDTWLLTGGANPVLRFSQGESFREPERDLLVYLRMRAGQGLENSTWTVAPDQKGDVPQILKRWKSGGALQQKAFTSGYVVKLEFGKRTEAGLPGRIYVALPDEDRTVVGGAFTAFIRVVRTATGGDTRTRPGDDSMLDE